MYRIEKVEWYGRDSMDELKENVIEWITGDKYIACTFTQKKYISKVRFVVFGSFSYPF